ncbi:hypothetical protein QOV31_005262 (plasmid) [Agrobacterium fabrum]|nr:hypothetical protein CN09_18985 [Rhizobium rhizogenes]TRB23420.1 LuxR family transcriptional regulator [Agrobacterium fabrum]QRM41760.1 LuxR family transcriptional regulator [Rhizobium rhizogenes]TQO74632.1 LuxR family transcriptional regulator [Rhizobium rhizogenes]TRB53458.1 LuxR family transcriptional regulator [Rhizobium rhizogenes]
MEPWILPPFEKTCLGWIAQGKTVSDIALLEGKTVAEIQHYLERAVLLLDVISIAEAVEKMKRLDEHAPASATDA